MINKLLVTLFVFATVLTKMASASTHEEITQALQGSWTSGCISDQLQSDLTFKDNTIKWTLSVCRSDSETRQSSVSEGTFAIVGDSKTVKGSKWIDIHFNNSSDSNFEIRDLYMTILIDESGHLFFSELVQTPEERSEQLDTSIVYKKQAQ